MKEKLRSVTHNQHNSFDDLSTVADNGNYVSSLRIKSPVVVEQRLERGQTVREYQIVEMTKIASRVSMYKLIVREA